MGSSVHLAGEHPHHPQLPGTADVCGRQHASHVAAGQADHGVPQPQAGDSHCGRAHYRATGVYVYVASFPGFMPLCQVPY